MMINVKLARTKVRILIAWFFMAVMECAVMLLARNLRWVQVGAILIYYALVALGNNDNASVYGMILLSVSLC